MDKSMAIAAVDRSVHHMTILELNMKSYKKRSALVQHRRITQRKERIKPTRGLKSEVGHMIL